MKYKSLFLGFFLLALLPQISAQSAAEQKVAAAVERLRKAMVDADKTALEELTTEKLSYGHSGGRVEGKAEFVDKIVSGKSDFVTIDLSEQTISISGNTAIVRHKLMAKTSDNGKPGEAHLLVLLVFQKEHKAWKLLARQAVKITS